MWLFVAACCASAAAATRIELKIDEARENRSVAWPITTGVPFPRGGLTDEKQCRLVDDRGEEQLLQTKVAATWDVARTSIRWLTIDFIAQPGRKYALEFGPEIKRQDQEKKALVGEGDVFKFGVGGMQVEFVRHGPSVLESISIDINDDGRIDPSEKIAGGPKDGDHAFVDQDGKRSTSERDGEERTLYLETAGPVRYCIRADGWYTAPDGRRIVKYRTRYHLFEELSLIKVVDEFGILGSTREVKFRDIALPLELNLQSESRRIVIPSTTAPDEIIPLRWDRSTRSVSVVQETYQHYGNPECRGFIAVDSAQGERRIGEAERVHSWIQVADDRATVTASLRWFRQQFPKEWRAADDRLTLHLWSPRAEPLDFGAEGLKKFFGPAGQKYLVDWKASGTSTPISNFFYYAGRQTMERDGADGLGINKHHEIWYHFGPASKAKEGREYGELADAQPICLATGEWNVGTDVFGPLAARPNDSPYEWIVDKYEAIVDKIFELERYGQDTFGDYGWFLFGAGPHYSYQWDPETKKHYADPRRFEYHTYQRETQLWWNYLRSGERKFYDWCFPSENHWVDIAVTHAPTKYTTQWRGGAPGEATLHYPKGDWSIDSSLHYVRHHDTGEAWLRSASQYWGSYHRTLETTTLAYYLTGDERYNDVVNFWKEYWSPLAGVRSDMPEGGKPWHREQMWWQPTKPGEPSKSWAEMLRDYAPFQSGSRHQQTLFFNLSTLYEHTWDPTIKKVLDEYAAAFLDPDSKNGVWQCQDHRLPANADSPMLAHYWSPALWKYARATQDPRMPGILKKYFTACIEADPFGCEVGIYSNNQIGWGWYFTKDPQYFVAALHELERLGPNADPLEKPEDLNRRIYNPYAPIMGLATVPRAIAVVQEGMKQGILRVSVLEPQRAPMAVEQPAGKSVTGTLWGWDRAPQWLDRAGRPLGRTVRTLEHRSHHTPFDRALPGYAVFKNDFAVDAPTKSQWLYLTPNLETGLLKLDGIANDVWCWAGEPICLRPREQWYWRAAEHASQAVIETAQPALLRVTQVNRLIDSYKPRPVSVAVVKNRMTVSLTDLPRETMLMIETTNERPVWFRIVDGDADARWVTNFRPLEGLESPNPPSSFYEVRTRRDPDVAQVFVPGKFGQGLLLVPGRELHIPDEITDADGNTRRLSDQRQGTMEFWIRRLWDDRTSTGPAGLQILNAGSLTANCPTPNLKFDEWTHVAIVWRPMPDGSDKSLVHAYFDGVDYAFYRSLAWEGYSKPAMFDPAKAWLKEFVTKGHTGALFVLDDIRISNKPRYVNLKLDFGRQQTFNPDAFTPPQEPATFDDSTVLLLPLDGNVEGTSIERRSIEATIVLERRPTK